MPKALARIYIFFNHEFTVIETTTSLDNGTYCSNDELEADGAVYFVMVDNATVEQFEVQFTDFKNKISAYTEFDFDFWNNFNEPSDNDIGMWIEDVEKMEGNNQLYNFYPPLVLNKMN